ncbi:MAG TPA: S41 family peptidase [Dehalococcoidia bacterium]|nr:S41 family peptidase [Dehalococcoidia bacterium]
MAIALIALACGDAPAKPGSVTDLAHQPGGIETVHRAYDVLLDDYVQPLKPADLLNAAWSGVADEAKAEGRMLPPAPRLSAARNADWDAFARAFATATRGVDAAPFAYAAVGAMARSLHDDHVFFLTPQQAARQRSGTQGGGGNGALFAARVLPGGIGYLQLRKFPAPYAPVLDGRNLGEALDVALAEFEAQGVSGWILDLRNNPGGAIASIATVTGRFMPVAPVQRSTSRCGTPTETLADGHLFTPRRPLAVLINQGSASAAEMTAAALHEYGAARLFGTRTAGAVAAAQLEELAGGGALEYTVRRVYTGKLNQPLDRTGVQPDMVVQMRAGGDAQLDAARAWLLGHPAPATLPAADAIAGGIARATADFDGHAVLARYGLSDLDLPGGVQLLGERLIDTPAEAASGEYQALTGARDLARIGWQGNLQQVFGSENTVQYGLGIDLYASDEGARASFDPAEDTRTPPKLDAKAKHERAADCPPLPLARRAHRAALPVRVGDTEVAIEAPGYAELIWTEGRLRYTVYATFAPGHESFGPLVPLARLLDARFHQHPLY